MADEGTIYTAVYSGVHVFEMVVNGIAVMRRRNDSYMNATQILKVANIEKGRRTKILEKEVLIGEHEKVQGGYGKYQGTWIPFDKSKELATRYGVYDVLSPIFTFDVDNPTVQQGEDAVLTKEQAIKKKAAETKQHSIQPRLEPSYKEDPLRKKPKLQNTTTTIPQPVEIPPIPYTDSSEHKRDVLMAIYLSDNPEKLPGLMHPTKEGKQLNVNMVIDEQGNTPLHWASGLARKNIIHVLVSKNANINSLNYARETPLMRAVMVTNNFDNDTFAQILDLLRDSISQLDMKKRSVLHHAALTAGLQGRKNAAVYYMKILVQYIRKNENLKYLLDLQDSLGDTCLNIAARLDCDSLIHILMEAGAQTDIVNRNGLESKDYGIKTEPLPSESTLQPKRMFPTTSNFSSKPYNQNQRGKEIIATVQKIVDALEEEYGEQLEAKEQELKKVQEELTSVTTELDVSRKGLEEKQAQSQQLSEVQQKIRTIETAMEQEYNDLKERMAQSQKAIASIEDIMEAEQDEEMFDVPDISNITSEEEKRKELEEYVKRMQAKTKAYSANNLSIEQEIQALDEQNNEREMQCKKLIAACCNLPIEKIDDLVEPLILAIESDPPDLDLARINGFMDKIRTQGSFNNSNNGPAKTTATTSN